MKVTIGFFFFLGGLGAFLLANRLTSSKWFGLFGALCFLLTPYLCTNVYVRGDLSEFAAMMITPWPCYFVLRAHRMQRFDCQSVFVFVGLTASLACIICMHPALALFYTVVFGLFTLGCLDNFEQQKIFLFLVCLAFLSGLVFSSPYWFTVWRMHDYVDLSRLHQGWFHPTGHLVNPKQFLASEWKYGASPGGLPLQLGWPHLLLAIVGMVANRRQRLMKFAAAMYLGLILAMTLVGYPLWRYLPLLNFVQFPWRLLSVVALVQLICICGIWLLLATRASSMRHGMLFVLAIVMIILARHQFQFESVRDINAQEILASSQSPFADFRSYAALDDYLPRTVLERPSTTRVDDSMVRAQGKGNVHIESLPGHSPYHPRVRSVTANDSASVVIDQFYFPGTRVLIDGCKVSPAEITDRLRNDGRMVVAIPAGSNVVLESYYDGPPGWRLHLLVVVLWFIALGVIVIFHRRGSS